MKIRYDQKYDILYIEFKDTNVTTKRLDEDIAIDYDINGEIAGIEILSAKERVFSEQEIPNIMLENIASKTVHQT